MRPVPSRLLLLTLVFVPLAAACGGSSASDLGAASDAASGDAAEGPDSGLALGQVALSTATLDFGAVVLTSTKTKTLTITNPGSDKVKVTLSAVAGPNKDRFTAAVNLPTTDHGFVIEANGIVTLTVSVAPRDVGPLLAVLALDSCGGACPQAIVLQANGVESGIVCPDAIDLGTVNPGRCATRPVRCTNTGNATERITVAELEPTSARTFTLSPPALPIDLAPLADLDLMVMFCPTDATRSQGDLRVSTFMPFQTDRSIHLVGDGGGANVSCSPSMVDFGTVGIGAPITADVTCTNMGVEASDVSGDVVGGGAFSVTARLTGPLAPNASAKFTIQVNATQPGMLSDVLRIATQNPDMAMIDIALAANAVMLTPCTAVLSPASYEFGLVGVGDARSAPIVLTNSGANECIIRDVHYRTGASPAFQLGRVPSSGTSVAAGGSLELEAIFAPSLSALTAATLEVSFSNPSSPSVSAAFTGEGARTTLVPNPTSLDFGATPAGCNNPRVRTVSLSRAVGGSGSITRIEVVPTSSSAFELMTGPLPATVGPFSRYDFTVRPVPSTGGDASAEIHVFADGIATPLIIPVHGTRGALGTRTERFSFAPPVVDVLFVVENSGFMAAAQDGLARAIGAFGSALLARSADFHFGVVTTDMISLQEAGRLQGSPRFVDAATPNVVALLSSRVAVGARSMAAPQPLAAVVAALTPPLADNENAGFLRAGATLAIVFVGDLDDASPGDVGEAIARIRGVASGRIVVAGVTPPAASSCVGRYGVADAAPRYAEILARTRAEASSFCTDLRESLPSIADLITKAPSFELGLRPRFSTITVMVNGANVPSQMGGRAIWSYEPGANSVAFVDRSAVPNGANVEIGYAPSCDQGQCGNMSTNMGEDCDDGNRTDTDQCTNACETPRCGDGIAETGVEVCDDGNTSNRDACLLTCRIASCGDGFVERGVEDCDDGNTTGHDGCPASCRFYTSSGIVPSAFVPLASPTRITVMGGQDPNDDGQAVLSLPFTFEYFDAPTTTITISVNGLIGFSDVSKQESYTSQSIPSFATPNGIVAAWWDDLYLDPGISGSLIGWQLFGSTPNRSIVIEWRHLRRQDHSAANHRSFDFQIELHETTSSIVLRYGDTATMGQVPSATFATAGLEDRNGDFGLEALGCSPECSGVPRPTAANGFPSQSSVTLTP
jgi:cysteine-rich repeat protein